MERRDVVIVGAGPAGSTCAWKLRRSGFDVLVVDRASFPRDKTCAGWITPAVLEILQIAADQYGQDRVLEPIAGFRVGVIGGRSVEVQYDRPVSYGIRRCEFDRYLVERSGAEFRPGTAVTSLRRNGHRWVLNDEIEASVIVGAGGHFCPIAREINPRVDPEPAVVTQEAEVLLKDGSGSSARPGVPEFYFTPDFKGYGWVFRKGLYVTVGLGRRDPNHLPSHLRTFLGFLEGRGRLGARDCLEGACASAMARAGATWWTTACAGGRCGKGRTREAARASCRRSSREPGGRDDLSRPAGFRRATSNAIGYCYASGSGSRAGQKRCHGSHRNG
jgi:flavin-dependent dehydrogenase